MTWLEHDLEFGKGQYIKFTEVSIASVASIRRQAGETTTLRAPDEPPNGCLKGSAPFLLEFISELVDVSELLWLVRPSSDTSAEDVSQTVSWRRVRGSRWPWESHDSAKLLAILNNTCTKGS